MRRTQAMRTVGQALMADPDAKHWGYSLHQTTGIRSGVLYPILQRFLDAGWLSAGWEKVAHSAGRPPRRYYKVTAKGRRALAEMSNNG